MSTALICLHGWGGSKESFTELRAALKNDSVTIFTPDLPGFGEEPEPKVPWTVDHYTGWVNAWIEHTLREEQKAGRTYDSIALLGHSHGGRITLKLAWRQSTVLNPHPDLLPEGEGDLAHLDLIEKKRNATRFANTHHSPLPTPSRLATLHYSHLFLCASAGIRRSRHIKRTIGFFLAKSGKWILSLPGGKYFTPITKKILYKLMRVHDYEQASDIMQKTMINVTQEDLTPLLSNITLNTDLFWGEDDTMTPLEDGVLMHKKIPNATLHTYANCRHRVHREKAEEIAAIIRTTLSL
jgi:pimeloyl-ACP methyl ester carboxylesterase